LHGANVQRIVVLVVGFDLACLAVLFHFLEYLRDGFVLGVKQLLQAFACFVDFLVGAFGGGCEVICMCERVFLDELDEVDMEEGERKR
jgi:uncharacterized membrane protein